MKIFKAGKLTALSLKPVIVLLAVSGNAYAESPAVLSEAETALSRFLDASSLSLGTTAHYDSFKLQGDGTSLIENLTIRKEGTAELSEIASGFKVRDDGEFEDLPDVDYSIVVNYGDVSVAGLKGNDGGITFDSWKNLEDVEIFGTFNFEGMEFAVVGGVSGLTVTDGHSPVPDQFQQNPERPFSSVIEWLASLSAGSAGLVSAESAFVSVSTEGEGGEWSMNHYVDDIEFHDIHDGHVSGMRIGSSGSESIMKNAMGDILSESSSNVGTTLAEDYNLNGLLSLFDPYANPDERVTLIGRSTTYGYRASQYEAYTTVEASAGKLETVNFSALPNGYRLAEAIDALISEKNDDGTRLAFEAFEFIRGFAADKMSIEGFEMHIDDPEIDWKGTFSVEESAIRDLSSNGIGAIEAVNVEFTGAPDEPEVALGRIGFRNIEFAHADGIHDLINTKAENGPNPILLMSPALIASKFVPLAASFEIEGMYVTGPQNFALDYFGSEFMTDKTIIPTGVKIRTEGLEFGTALADEALGGSTFADLGLTTVLHQNNLNLYWDEATQEVVLEDLLVDVGDFGTLKAAFTLGGVPRSVLEDPETNIMQLLGTGTIIGGEIVLTDNGGLDRAVAARPELGGSRRSAAEFAKSHINARLGFLGPDFLKQSESAIDAVVNGATQVTISIEPSNPVPMMQAVSGIATSPHMAMKILGASIKAQ